MALGAAALDQATKLAVVATIPEGGSRPLLDDVLRVSDVRNSGAAFGSLRGVPGLLALAALVGVVAFLGVVVREPRGATGLGAALVAGGALGNLVDRLVRPGGRVVDFIDFRFWPAFNVADACITVGAILVVAAGLRDRRGGREDAAGRS